MVRYYLTFLFAIIHFCAFAQDNVVPTTNDIYIKGAVKNELHLSINDILRFRQDSLGDIILRNKQGKEKGVIKNLRGVLLKTILDSAQVTAEKHKDYSELFIVLVGSDNYKNVYSWNEVFNTEVGNHIYLITARDGKTIGQMDDRILVMSLADLNSGRRHLKGLAKIEVKKIQ